MRDFLKKQKHYDYSFQFSIVYLSGITMPLSDRYHHFLETAGLPIANQHLHVCCRDSQTKLVCLPACLPDLYFLLMHCLRHKSAGKGEPAVKQIYFCN